MKDNRNLIEEARDEIKRFVKSGQEQPSSRMVAVVNEFFRSIVKRKSQMDVESAVEWRTIAAQRLVIDLIKDFSNDELQKAEKALNSIAGTFATVRWVGGEWRAYVARDGRTADRGIDQATSFEFKSGTLSMGDFIEKVFPHGLPEKKTSQSHRKGWRR